MFKQYILECDIHYTIINNNKFVYMKSKQMYVIHIMGGECEELFTLGRVERDL